MKSPKQTKAALLQANATLRRTNAALRKTNTLLTTDIEGYVARDKAKTDENNLLHEQLRKQTANIKREIAKETAELHQQVILKADTIDGLQKHNNHLTDQLRWANRREKELQSEIENLRTESNYAVADITRVKDAHWEEIVDVRTQLTALEAENVRIKALHVAAMEFIGTHIHFLKANHQ